MEFTSPIRIQTTRLGMIDSRMTEGTSSRAERVEKINIPRVFCDKKSYINKSLCKFSVWNCTKGRTVGLPSLSAGSAWFLCRSMPLASRSHRAIGMTMTKVQGNTHIVLNSRRSRMFHDWSYTFRTVEQDVLVMNILFIPNSLLFLRPFLPQLRPPHVVGEEIRGRASHGDAGPVSGGRRRRRGWGVSFRRFIQLRIAGLNLRKISTQAATCSPKTIGVLNPEKYRLTRRVPWLSHSDLLETPGGWSRRYCKVSHVKIGCWSLFLLC